MRETSTTARAALYAAQTPLVFLHLVTIEHDDLATPIRLVDNLEDIVSGGDTYTAFPIRVQLPPDVPGEIPSLDMVVDAVDQTLIQALRSIATPPTVSIEVIIASTPNTIEAGPFAFEVLEAQYNATEVRLRLEAERLLSEPYPSGLFTPTHFPMLFQAVGR